MKIIYVCTGNICRSPLAEAVTRHELKKLGLENAIETASAGTHGYHIGEPPDLRSIEVAAQRGISMKGQKAQKISLRDFAAGNLLLAMDMGHYEHLLAMAPAGSEAEIALFMDYACGRQDDVPDPYYGDISDFEQVLDLVVEGVAGVLKKSALTQYEK